MLFSACQEEPIEPEDLHADYWGCWTTGITTSHDVTLEDNGPRLHTFAIVEACGLDVVASMDLGFFRNDTLILDNGTFEFWCYLEDDTLSLSAYAAGFDTAVLKLTKIF